MEALLRHIRNKAPAFRDRTIETIYFGGGTPSLAGAKNLMRVLDTIRNSFMLSADAEITTEANPGDIYADSTRNPATRYEGLQVLRKAGFNRISLGVQSSDDTELKMLGRRHTYEQAVEAVEDARKAGFSNLTLDLMYGLPHQTAETWHKSLSDIVSLSPEHISCYALRPEEGTPIYSLLPEMPDDDTVSDQYLTAVSFLAEHGYQQYEVSNYARSGRESRHNSRYWTGGDYLSFGPSAHSYMNGTRYAYADNTRDYIAAVNADKEPAYGEFVVLTEQDKLEETIMLRLRMAAGLDLDILAKQFGIDTNRLERILRTYVSHGLCRSNGRVFSLTSQGMFVQNSIIVSLFEQFDS